MTCAAVAEAIEDEMQARGWDLDALALRMGGEWAVTRLALELFLECRDEPKLIVGDFMARQLSIAFGVAPEFFVNLERAEPASDSHTPPAEGVGKT